MEWKREPGEGDEERRPSGRLVAEIKDTIQKIRAWLGTYDTAEEAARAYVEAACLLHGANTRTNLWPCSPSSHSKRAARGWRLSAKIVNLLRSWDCTSTFEADDSWSNVDGSVKEMIGAQWSRNHHGDEPPMKREIMKRWTHERKFSASLYANNGGKSECF
ncbi:hypothetical protein NC653_019851 [Populus alba x Populus x berolinensis]|uniref:AP2/ERF domain-containing protein n=1 Tax=Populus alba x Populus x berolinensis TaxID=444605 RepID=A0AAD6QDQ8_9ROSI|nr:hypothetical protein NC653_019851 [Populus alba x Populus x berolinensis]